MTRNQIDYWILQETKRSNLAKEGETHRANLAKESLSGAELSEKVRANQAAESLKLMGVQEDVRHNLASEELKGQEQSVKASDTVYDNISGTLIDVGKTLVQLLPFLKTKEK